MPVKPPPGTGEVPLPKGKELTAKLGIRRFDAGHDGDRIRIVGVVYSVWPQPVPFSYKVSRWDGPNWVLVSSGGARVPPKGTFDAKADMSTTPGAVRLRLDINAARAEQASKEFNLAAQ
jgi:hypothetical protein